MLPALPALPVQLKSDPAPASAARPGARIAGDNSFASLIRRQAEQRLDALRLADQQALAARVSAAAATAMPRPAVEHLASRPPMPGQTPAEPAPPKAVPSAAATPADATAHSNGAQPGPAPTRPAQASPASARAKPGGSASRTDPARSPMARSDPADNPATSRTGRERKPGMAPGVDVSAEDAAPGAAALPPLPADSRPSGLAGDLSAVVVEQAGPASEVALEPILQPATGLPQDRATLPAEQAATGPAASAAASEVASDRPALPANQPASGQARSASGAIAAEETRRSGPTQRPSQALAEFTLPDAGEAESAAAPRAHAGGAASLQADPGEQGADLAVLPGDPLPLRDQLSAPAIDSPDSRHQRELDYDQ